MKIRVNGQETELGQTVENLNQLLTVLDVQRQRAAVEINGTIIDPRQFETTPVRDGDSVEIVCFVGGG